MPLGAGEQQNTDPLPKTPGIAMLIIACSCPARKEGQIMPKSKKKKSDPNIRLRADGRYEVRLTMGKKADGTANRVCAYFATRGEARRYRDDLKVSRATGDYMPVSGTRLRDWCERCMRVYGPALSDTTWRGYISIINCHLYPSPLAGMMLEDIRKSHITMWRDNLRPKGGKVSLSPKTVKNSLDFLRWLFNHAVEDGIIQKNPADKVSAPRQRRPVRKVLSPDNLPALFEAASSCDLFAPLVLDAVTGVRRSELLGFCWDAIDLDAGTYRVARKVVVDRNTHHPHLTDDLKTDHAYRSGRLPAAAVRILAAHKKVQSEQRLKAGGAWSDHNLLFPDALGYPLNPETFSSRLRRLQIRACLDPVGFQALRHYVATALINGHVEEATIAQIMGHGNSAYTRRQYEDVYDAAKQNAAAVLADSVNFLTP